MIIRVLTVERVTAGLRVVDQPGPALQALDLATPMRLAVSDAEPVARLAVLPDTVPLYALIANQGAPAVNLAARLKASSAVSATLSVEEAEAVLLAGSILATSALTGVLSVDEAQAVLLSGAVAATSSLTGDLVVIGAMPSNTVTYRLAPVTYAGAAVTYSEI